MKYTKKLVALTVALILALALAMPAMAAQTADLDINGTTEGKKYDLYKVFDLTQAGENYSYTVNEDFAEFFENYEAYQTWLAQDGNADKTPIDYVGTLTPNSEAIGALADELLAYAVANKATITPIEVTGATGTSTTVNNLEYGYYLLNALGATETASGYYSMFALNTLSGNDASITVKGTYPTVDKTVEDGTDNATGTNVSEASVGDEVTYTLSAKVPDMTGFPSYIFRMKDTMTKGLTYKGITEVKIGDTPLSADVDYTATTDSGDDSSTILTINFLNFIQYADQQGAEITVKYKAEINANAIAGVTADNKVKVEYSNDPKNPDNVNGVTAESDTKTYNTSLTINKVDGEMQPLAGAAFRITGDSVNMVVTTGDVYVVSAEGTYYKLLNGTYTTEVPTLETENLYDSTTTKYELKENVVLDTEEGTSKTVYAEAFVDAETGVLKFDGLGAGTYTISEVVVPNGYNAIEDFQVMITFDSATGTFSATANNGQQVNANGPFSMTIVNQSGTELPSTGGIGTTIFYTLGGLLVVGAAILLVTKKRVHDMEA